MFSYIIMLENMWPHVNLYAHVREHVFVCDNVEDMSCVSICDYDRKGMVVCENV